MPESLEPVPEFMEALGESDSFLEFQALLSRVAQVERPVLLLGERGTGKELAARRLHFLSQRWNGPFVALDCSSITPSLIESELFGHESGSFTGATQRRLGRFEMAHGGTLFLDELGNVPLEVQAKLLRAVEYGTFERVGGTQPVHTNVRILGATHADLQHKGATGSFMPDLLDRLAFEVLHLPPLRARQGDIVYLARHFAQNMAQTLGRSDMVEFTAGALEALESHLWPGNVRELKNVVERSVFRAEGSVVDTVVLDPFRVAWGSAAELEKEELEKEDNLPAHSVTDLKTAVGELELKAVREALHAAQYNQTKAAQQLGLSYHQFRGLYRKHQAALTQ